MENSETEVMENVMESQGIASEFEPCLIESKETIQTGEFHCSKTRK